MVRGARCLGVFFVPRGLARRAGAAAKVPWACVPQPSPQPALILVAPMGVSGAGVGDWVSCFARLAACLLARHCSCKTEPRASGARQAAVGHPRSCMGPWRPCGGGLQLSCGPDPWMPASVWVFSSFPSSCMALLGGTDFSCFSQGPRDNDAQSASFLAQPVKSASSLCWQPVRE